LEQAESAPSEGYRGTYISFQSILDQYTDIHGLHKHPIASVTALYPKFYKAIERVRERERISIANNFKPTL